MAYRASDKQIAFATRLFHGLAAHKGNPTVESTLAAHAAVLRDVIVNQDADGKACSRAIDAMLTLTKSIEAGHVSGAVAPFVPATEAQVRFLSSLLAERSVEGVTLSLPRDAAGNYTATGASKAQASEAIGIMKEQPHASRPAAAASNVPADVQHGDVFVTPEHDLLIVRASRSTGRFYASIAAYPTTPGRIRWEWMKGGMAQVARSRKVTAEEAAALGHVTHHCCFCGTELSDEGDGRSVEMGYGPVCAAKRGLPWG